MTVPIVSPWLCCYLLLHWEVSRYLSLAFFVCSTALGSVPIVILAFLLVVGTLGSMSVELDVKLGSPQLKRTQLKHRPLICAWYHCLVYYDNVYMYHYSVRHNGRSASTPWLSAA